MESAKAKIEFIRGYMCATNIVEMSLNFKLHNDHAMERTIRAAVERVAQSLREGALPIADENYPNAEPIQAPK